MSTPTAIEIVREMQLWRRAQGKYGLDDYPPGMPFSPREYGVAIDAVLRDAERFAALERAHLNPPFKGSIAVKVFDPERFEYVLYKGELSELADRLKNGGAK